LLSQLPAHQYGSHLAAAESHSISSRLAALCSGAASHRLVHKFLYSALVHQARYLTFFLHCFPATKTQSEKASQPLPDPQPRKMGRLKATFGELSGIASQDLSPSCSLKSELDNMLRPGFCTCSFPNNQRPDCDLQANVQKLNCISSDISQQNWHIP
jgi:hypothetical protein